jgi:hypothetical protein
MTTTTERLISTITAQDKRALKHADKIIFRLYEDSCTIECVKDGEHTSDGFEQTHTIYCDVKITDYSASHSWVEPERLRNYTGFHMEHTGVSFNDDLRTLVDMIPIGGRLTLSWTRGNDNESNREIGWVRDELRLIVHHPGREVAGQPQRKPRQPWSFIVEIRVGPDNTARMVKSDGRA